MDQGTQSYPTDPELFVDEYRGKLDEVLGDLGPPGDHVEGQAIERIRSAFALDPTLAKGVWSKWRERQLVNTT